MQSRAVRRRVEPGNDAFCVYCEQPVKFRAKEKLVQVIANVYKNGKWDRVEHFHDQCYILSQKPHGELQE